MSSRLPHLPGPTDGAMELALGELGRGSTALAPIKPLRNRRFFAAGALTFPHALRPPAQIQL